MFTAPDKYAAPSMSCPLLANVAWIKSPVDELAGTFASESQSQSLVTATRAKWPIVVALSGKKRKLIFYSDVSGTKARRRWTRLSLRLRMLQ